MKLAILILEDEAPVREALERDLARFAATVRIEAAEDVGTAQTVIEGIAASGDRLALVMADHRLPGTSGIDFLIGLDQDTQTESVGKILVTGQADLGDTIRAINEARLDRFIPKPWDPGMLISFVRELLTDYVLANRIDPLPHLAALDAPRALGLLRDGTYP